jgi:hypothetical protein
MAALAAVAQELLKAPGAMDLVDNAPSWRFSGRWFNAGPYALRRPHRTH